MLIRLDPLAKLVVCLAWLAAAMLILDPGFQALVIALFAGALLVTRSVTAGKLLLLLIPFALFGLGFLTTTVLFREEDGYALAMAEAAPVASGALPAGITLFLRALACGTISILFALTSDPGALVRALMARAKLPAAIGFALFAAFQLVPDLAEELRLARMAAAMRTGRVPRRWLGPREAMRLVVPLLAFAIRRAGRTAIAMEARGFVPGAPRSLVDVPVAGATDFLFAGAALLLLCVLVAAFAL